jgi:hypothetical protein
MILQTPLGGQPQPMNANLLSYPLITPTVVRWVSVKSKQSSKVKEI